VSALAVPGSTGVHEQQGILLAHDIAILNFLKQLGRVGELSVELVANLAADFVTAWADARADCSMNVARIAGELAPHHPHAFFHNTSKRASPTCVKRADSPPLCVYDEHWQAIRRLHGNQNSCGRGDEAVAGRGSIGNSVDFVNVI